MERRDRRVVDHVQEVALDHDSRHAIPDIQTCQGAVLAAGRERVRPFHELCVAVLDVFYVVQLLVGNQHHRTIGRVFGFRIIPYENRVLRLQHATDAKTELGLFNAHLGEFLLHRDVAHQTTFFPDHLDIVGERLDLEVAFL